MGKKKAGGRKFLCWHAHCYDSGQNFLVENLKLTKDEKDFRMKVCVKILLGSLLAIFLMSGSAMATYINPMGGGNGSEANLDQIMGNIGYSGGMNFTGNTNDNDALGDGIDSYWTANGTSTASFIIELAGYASGNRFGIYENNSGSVQRVELFSGAATVGATVTMSIEGDGSVLVNNFNTGIDFLGNDFGFYFNNKPDQLFYSDTALNSDNFDHMVAFQGDNSLLESLLDEENNPITWTDDSYILAWEDLAGGGDKDYNDMVLKVESVSPAPVPEPATMFLFGSGLIGLAGFRRKFIK